MPTRIVDIIRAMESDAQYLRELKTRSNKIRKKYVGKQQRAEFVDQMETHAILRASRLRENLVMLYGYDALNWRWIEPALAPTTEHSCTELLVGVMFLQATGIHLRLLHNVVDEAEANGENLTEYADTAFNAWLDGRTLAPLIVICSLMNEPDIPEDIRTAAISLVSGWVISETSIESNPTLKKSIGTMAQPYDELSGTVITEWQGVAKPIKISREFDFVKTVRKKLESPSSRFENQFPVDSETGALLDTFPSSEDNPEQILMNKSDSDSTEDFENMLRSARLSPQQKRVIETLRKYPELLTHGGNKKLSEMFGWTQDHAGVVKKRAFDKVRATQKNNS